MGHWLIYFLCFWFGLALVGGIVDGQLFHGISAGQAIQAGSSADYFSGVNQISVLTSPYTSTGWNPLSWMAATGAYIAAWGNILLLNSSLFEGVYGIVRWFLLLGSAGLLAEIASRLFGR